MVTFHEDGMILEVEVLEDTSDADWYRYRLRIIRVIQDNPLLGPPEAVGEEFSVDQYRHGAWGGMWYLEGYETERSDYDLESEA
jgi:hypothetical protein